MTDGPQSRIRKQVYDLTLDDLARCATWEFASDEEGEEGQDEATVRPCEPGVSIDCSTFIGVVRTHFRAAGGQRYLGYVTPAHEDTLGAMQPTIVLDHTQIAIWHGIDRPDRSTLNEYYTALGITAAQCFPLSFSPAIAVTKGYCTGTVNGFAALVKLGSRKVVTFT